MPAIEQHRGPAIKGRELEPAGGGHVGSLHLGNHARERSVTQAVFRHRQHLRILGALRIEDAVRAKPDLLQSRCVEIELRQRP